MVSWVSLRKVGVSDVPFRVTVDAGMKPVPKRVKVWPAESRSIVEGESAVTVGTGFEEEDCPSETAIVTVLLWTPPIVSTSETGSPVTEPAGISALTW